MVLPVGAVDNASIFGQFSQTMGSDGGFGFLDCGFFSSSVLSGKVIAVQLFGTCCSRGRFEQVEGAFNGQCRTWSLIVMNYFFYGSREKFKLVASRRLLCI